MNSKLRDILDELTNPLVDVRTHLYLPDHKITEAEKAIRQAVSEEVLAMFPPMWVITEQPDEYARQKALGYNQGLAELRQKIKEWAAHQGDNQMNNHIDKGQGFTHHDDSECCPCPCKETSNE